MSSSCTTQMVLIPNSWLRIRIWITNLIRWWMTKGYLLQVIYNNRYLTHLKNGSQIHDYQTFLVNKWGLFWITYISKPDTHMTTTILNIPCISISKYESDLVTEWLIIIIFWVAILRKQLNFHSYTTIHSFLQYKKLCKKTFWATHYLTKQPVDVDTRILSHYSKLYISMTLYENLIFFFCVSLIQVSTWFFEIKHE